MNSDQIVPQIDEENKNNENYINKSPIENTKPKHARLGIVILCFCLISNLPQIFS